MLYLGKRSDLVVPAVKSQRRPSKKMWQSHSGILRLGSPAKRPSIEAHRAGSMATAELCRAQLWQWIRHSARLAAGHKVDRESG